jgi:hypothetical protein
MQHLVTWLLCVVYKTCKKINNLQLVVHVRLSDNLFPPNYMFPCTFQNQGPPRQSDFDEIWHKLCILSQAPYFIILISYSRYERSASSMLLSVLGSYGNAVNYKNH